MKKKILFMSALLCALLSFTACSNDDDEPSVNWNEVLPTDEISIGNDLDVEFNGAKVTSGNVKFTVEGSNANTATLALNDIVPGYGEIDIPVTLEKTADNSYTFKGTLAVTSAPQMTRMESAGYTIYNLSVDGNGTGSKCTISITSALSEEAQGGITGTWKLLDKAISDATTNSYSSAPMMMTWSANDATKPNMAGIANIAMAFGNPILYNLLENVTFNADGNITASYYTPVEGENITDFMSGTEDNGDGTYSYKIVHKGAWSHSPKNLAFWYAKDGCIYVTPNIKAILGATGSSATIDFEQIAQLAATIGVDPTKLVTALKTWNQTGIPVKYTNDGTNLKVYVDKELAAPIIELLLPTLPTLQQMYENMPDSDTKSMISMMLFMMNGATSFNDIATIWNENTKDFGISLNFTKE